MKAKHGRGDSNSTEEYSDGDRRRVAPSGDDKRGQTMSDKHGNGSKGDSVAAKNKQKHKSVVNSDRSETSTAR